MNLQCLSIVAALLTTSSAMGDKLAMPASHTVREIQGWKVHVDDRLLMKPDAELGQLALGLLEGQLRNVALVMPKEKLKALRQVPIWLDLTHGKLKSPQYHPSANWLADHGYSRELAKCVHLPDAKYFTGARFQREQPWGVLHELAHAYHDRVLGFNHAEIKAAYQEFVKGGKYKSILHINGKMQSHYALTNAQEFFAEMTECYFGQNDLFPFNSGELKHEEPEIFDLMSKIWGPLP
jgi:hypothetical protein